MLLDQPIWDFTNAILYCDAAFTGCRLFRHLWDKRGIGAVGPVNGSKPNTGGGANSWPIQNFKNADARYLHRGWHRLAFTPLQRGGWMQVNSL